MGVDAFFFNCGEALGAARAGIVERRPCRKLSSRTGWPAGGRVCGAHVPQLHAGVRTMAYFFGGRGGACWAPITLCDGSRVAMHKAHWVERPSHVARVWGRACHGCFAELSRRLHCMACLALGFGTDLQSRIQLTVRAGRLIMRWAFCRPL